jgi:hypothetical protein
VDENVVELASVRPKTLNKQYKNQRYKLEFQPTTGQWKWTVYIVRTSSFSEVAPTMVAAQRAAERCIEKTLGTRGNK